MNTPTRQHTSMATPRTVESSKRVHASARGRSSMRRLRAPADGHHLICLCSATKSRAASRLYLRTARSSRQQRRHRRHRQQQHGAYCQYGKESPGLLFLFISSWSMYMCVCVCVCVCVCGVMFVPFVFMLFEHCVVVAYVFIVCYV